MLLILPFAIVWKLRETPLRVKGRKSETHVDFPLAIGLSIFTTTRNTLLLNVSSAIGPSGVALATPLIPTSPGSLSLVTKSTGCCALEVTAKSFAAARVAARVPAGSTYIAGTRPWNLLRLTLETSMEIHFCKMLTLTGGLSHLNQNSSPAQSASPVSNAGEEVLVGDAGVEAFCKGLEVGDGPSEEVEDNTSEELEGASDDAAAVSDAGEEVVVGDAGEEPFSEGGEAVDGPSEGLEDNTSEEPEGASDDAPAVSDAGEETVGEAVDGTSEVPKITGTSEEPEGASDDEETVGEAVDGTSEVPKITGTSEEPEGASDDAPAVSDAGDEGLLGDSGEETVGEAVAGTSERPKITASEALERALGDAAAVPDAGEETIGEGLDGTSEGSDGTSEGVDGTSEGVDGTSGGVDGTSEGMDGTSEGVDGTSGELTIGGLGGALGAA
ncbi:hypothetical protein JB92DRAFT_3096552 [Gautieria morchelliformis]|nr:hypothetical protein JB92DRAFT_3096552 [Gautieria morchelliformis]